MKRESLCPFNNGKSIFVDSKFYSWKNDVPKSVSKASKACKPFNIKVPIQKGWDESKNRMLFICEQVHTEDLKAGLLLDVTSGNTLSNCFRYSQSLIRNLDRKPPQFSFAAINYNFFKTYHLKPNQKTLLGVHAYCRDRVFAFIKRTKPTHVFVSGCDAAYNLFNDIIPNLSKKIGWVIDTEIEGVKFKLCFSVDFVKAIDVSQKNQDKDDSDDTLDDDKKLAGALCLGYFSRCLRNLCLGEMPFVSKVKPNYVLVDSIKKFDKMMKELDAAKKVAIDTEAQNLNRRKNKIYTIQFATSSDKGYVLPYLHGDTPFSTKDLSYIHSKLREFFSKKVPLSTNPEKAHLLLMFNGKFDLSVLRNQFGIRVFHWPVWDVRAGESCLDENIKFLGNVAKIETFSEKQMSHGGLAQILCDYGNDFYYTAEFGKNDRGDMDNTKLTKGFLEYGAMDAQSLMSMFELQMQRAKFEFHSENGERYDYSEAYFKLVAFQMSNNIHDFSVMEYRGVNLDKKYLLFLKTKESPISEKISELSYRFKKSKYAKKANKKLLKQNNNYGNSLFGDPWIFSINKPAHKQLLFIDVMGLEPIGFGKSGDASLGKLFKKIYKSVPEVMMLDELEKVKKLKTSYVNAFIRYLSKGDGVDGRLRASFDFFPVVTGRSNSSDPSLQQIPSRGPYAKFIKRSFVAPENHIIIKQDYSAHEIRGWSIISGDKLLGDLFNIGRKLRKKYYKTGKRKYKRAINEKGDVHKLNQNYFFGTPINEITDEQRSDIKAVGFGAIYGKSVKTLAKDLKKALEVVQELVNKYFGRYKKASGWLDWAKKFSEKNLFVYSPIGRRRYLFGYLTGVASIMAAMRRRAMNSPIQGMSADIGHTAARLFSINMEKVLFDLKRITEDTTELPNDIEVQVHDSVRTETPFDNILVTIHILQWVATKGVVEYYKKYFDMSFTVYPEVEMEFGVSEDKMYKWDWSLDTKPLLKDKKDKDGNILEKADDSFSLSYCLTETIKDYKKIYKEDRSVEDILKIIYADWKNSKVKKYLDENYPILPD